MRFTEGGLLLCLDHTCFCCACTSTLTLSFRGKGEGGSGSAAPTTRRDPIPTPAASKPKDPLPRTTSHSRRNKPTQALRIDGFVRPLTVQKTQAMLSDFGEIQKLWMPSMKTHAFVVFATAEQAEKCLQATNGKKWPPGNVGST